MARKNFARFARRRHSESFCPPSISSLAPSLTEGRGKERKERKGGRKGRGKKEGEKGKGVEWGGLLGKEKKLSKK